MVTIGAVTIGGDNGSHLDPVPMDLEFDQLPAPRQVAGDIQYPSRDLLYRRIDITTTTQGQRPMFEIDEAETVVRLFSDSITALDFSYFSPIPNTRRYIMNPTRRWGFRPATFAFTIRTRPAVPAPGVGPDADSDNDGYTTRAAVERLLPRGLPNRIGDSDFARWIAHASHEIDAEVGRDFSVLGSGWKFAVAPDSPPIIELIAQWLSAAAAYAEIREINRGARDEKSADELYRARALQKLGRIRRGEIEVESVSTGEDLGNPTSPITTLAPTPQFANNPLGFR